MLFREQQVRAKQSQTARGTKKWETTSHSNRDQRLLHEVGPENARRDLVYALVRHMLPHSVRGAL